MAQRKVIEVKGINKSFSLGKRENKVLKDVTLDIYSGQLTCIFGPSGCGKSTLLNVIMGLERPDSGSVRVVNENIWDMDISEQTDFRKRHIGVVYQQQIWVRSLTVIENVALPAQLLGINKSDALNRAEKVLQDVGMLRFRDFYTSELSSGEQQKVGLARALITDPEIVIADEPTGNLDTKNGYEVLKVLKELAQKGVTVVLVTHNPEYLDYCDTVVVMKDGSIMNVLKGGKGILSKVQESLNAKDIKVESRTEYKVNSENSVDHEYYPGESFFEKLGGYIKLIISFFTKSLSLLILSLLRKINPNKSAQLRKSMTKSNNGDMSLLDLTELSFKNVFFKRFRTLITILGVSLGVGFVVLLVSIGYGVEDLVIAEVTKAQNLNQVDVFPKVGSQLKLNDELVEKVSAISGVSKIYRIKNFPGRIDYKGSTVDVVVYGVESGYLENSPVKKVSGEFLNDESDKFSAIINSEYLKTLGLSTDIIGETLNLNVIQSVPESEIEAKNIPATIIGVVEDDSPPVIYLKIGSVRDYTEDEYSALSIIVNKESSLDFVRKQIESLGLETFSIMDTVNQVQQIFTYVRYGLLAFGILAFAIAFLGMINTLTVSLLERTREVGLMKIIGMKKKDIQFLFITESMFIGLLGGIFGILLGILGGYIVSLVVYLLSSSRGVEFMVITSFPFVTALIVILITTLLSFFTGLYPANRAVKIPTMDAVRYE
jgi:ABC-type lipoprotein export system ATPase subunit/ABC-type antimicrobial peptide transport system permease subunit